TLRWVLLLVRVQCQRQLAKQRAQQARTLILGLRRGVARVSLWRGALRSGAGVRLSLGVRRAALVRRVSLAEQVPVGATHPRLVATVQTTVGAEQRGKYGPHLRGRRAQRLAQRTEPSVIRARRFPRAVLAGVARKLLLLDLAQQSL